MKKVLMRPLDGRPVIDRLCAEFAPGYDYPDLSMSRYVAQLDRLVGVSEIRDEGSET